MWLVGEIRIAIKSKGNVGVFQTDSLSMVIPSKAQNTCLIYSVRRLLLKINCSNVLNTLFTNKAVVNLAKRALVTNRLIFLISSKKLSYVSNVLDIT